MTRNEEPTETSPLLGGGGGGGATAEQNGSVKHPTSSEAGLQNETSQNNGETLERQDSIDESRAAQFAGNSDVRKNLKYIVPAVSVGIFLTAADQTIAMSCYGKIGSELNALNLTSWIATSYFLTLTSFQPLYGKLSDIFGRKSCLLSSYAVFGLGCLFCGLAQDINQLIVARAVQGMGGGGMTTVVSVIFSDIVPLKERGVWQGLLNMVFALGSGVGAPAGGLLTDKVSWRWIFLGQVPLCVLAFVAVTVFLNLPSLEQEENWKKRLRRLDFPGALTLVCAVFAIIFGLDRGSNVAWSLPVTYVPLTFSPILFTLLVYIEGKVAREPFAPWRVIFPRPMLSGLMCNFCSFAAYMACLYYVPLYYQAVDGLGAAGAALRLVPAIVAIASGSLVGGYMMKKTGKYYWLTFTGYVILAVGLLFVLLCTGVLTRNTYGIVGGVIFCGFGTGIGVTTSLIALISNAKPHDQAVTTAASYLFRSLGSVVGISLSSATIQSQLRRLLAHALGNGRDARKIEQRVRQSLDYLKQLDPNTRAIVESAYRKAVSYGFGVMLVFAVGAVVASLFIREERISR